jgi:hypothetical protein
MKFKIKEGVTRTKAAKAKTNLDAIARQNLDREVDAKLTALMGEKPQETIQVISPSTKEEEVKAKLPMLPMSSVSTTSLDPKKGQLELSDVDAINFEVLASAYSQRKTLENQLKNENEADRIKILEVMRDKNEYTGKKVDVTIVPVKNEYVDINLVISASFPDEKTIQGLKAGLAQIRNLVRLNLFEIKKGDFEKYLKTGGVDSTPFIKKATPTKRLTVKAKIQQ